MFTRGGLSFDPASSPALPEDSAKSNYSRTYRRFARNPNHSRTYAKQGVYPPPSIAVSISACSRQPPHKGKGPAAGSSGGAFCKHQAKNVARISC